MNADDVYQVLKDFIKNDFCHLRKKVDKLLWVIITGLITIIFLLVK